MELFNEKIIEIDGIQIISRKLVGYTMGVPYLMEPLLIAKLVKNENIIYKVHKEVEIYLEMKEMIHDFIEKDGGIYLITKLGLYFKDDSGGLRLIVADYMTAFDKDTVKSESGNIYDLLGQVIGTLPVVNNEIAPLNTTEDIIDGIIQEFNSLPNDIKLGISEIFFNEYHQKNWIDVEDFYPKEEQKIELSQMKFDPNKVVDKLDSVQNNRIADKQVKRIEALKEMDSLKGLKPRRGQFESNREQREPTGVLNHIERYTSSKTLYNELFKSFVSSKNKLMMSLLGMDIDHFHTFATLNQKPLKEYILIDHEVRLLAVKLEEAREDLKRVKSELKKKTMENQGYLDEKKKEYNQIKLVYSDRVKYKEQVLDDLNEVYEKYMNDIPQFSMSLIGYSNEIINVDDNVLKKRFYLLSQKIYKDMCDLLQNQKIKHENTSAQKFHLLREYNVKQSNKQILERNIVQLKNDIKAELSQKFGRAISLEEAEKLMLSAKEAPLITAIAVDPKAIQMEKELLESKQKEQQLLLVQTQLNMDIEKLNSEYLSSIQPVIEQKVGKKLELDIEGYTELNKTAKSINIELANDINELKKYPSKAFYFKNKWIVPQ